MVMNEMYFTCSVFGMRSPASIFVLNGSPLTSVSDVVEVEDDSFFILGVDV